jgi:undecaprenyl diphosphate synthase
MAKEKQESMRKAQGNIPRHVGIILDGNGRWAKKRGLTRSEGHIAGYENLKKLVPFIFSQGVEVVTVFAFSTENWKRNQKEVDGIFDLFSVAIKESMPKLIEEGVRIKFIGDRTKFGESLQQGMRLIEEESEKIEKENLRGTFVVAINYGGKEEIVRAIKEIVRLNVHPAYINERCVSGFLYTAGLPDPDLIIRTGCKPGEMRLSNFLPWQSAYSEYYGSRKYLPDFGDEDFKRALRSFARRKRLRGGDRVA